MKLKKVTPRFFVSEQINAHDIGLAAAQGIKTIICNRPDHEQAGQPDAKSIADAAADLGIDFINMPVPSGSISDDNITDFAKAYKSVKGPILAYCRSGMRCTTLWALTEAELLDVNTIMSTAMDAGYDLKGLRPRLES
jgi:sulfide:quinone oxidoreductase